MENRIRKLKKHFGEHLDKEQEFLIQQLELLNKESCKANGKELADLTFAMCKVLRAMSIPYALRLSIFFVVFAHLLIGFVVFIKNHFWRCT